MPEQSVRHGTLRSCQLSAVSFQLRATSCQLSATSFELPTTSDELPASRKSSEPTVTTGNQLLVVNVESSPDNMRRTSTAWSAIFAAADLSKYARSATRMARYSISLAEPAPYRRNRANSLSPPRELPSAMFEGMEMAARRSCETRPYSSFSGKLAVFTYTSSASACALCHTCRFLKSCIAASSDVAGIGAFRSAFLAPNWKLETGN
jgi:hypothetical protein